MARHLFRAVLIVPKQWNQLPVHHRFLCLCGSLPDHFVQQLKFGAVYECYATEDFGSASLCTDNVESSARIYTILAGFLGLGEARTSDVSSSSVHAGRVLI